MQTIQARWFTKVGPSRLKQVICLHDMEASQKPETAENIGYFFQKLSSENKASAHVGVDMNSRVRYVGDDDVAFAAPASNHHGLHLEQAGWARFTRGEWTQPEMMLQLQQSAAQVREWCDRYGIPKRFVNAGDLRAGRLGITTHYEVSQAWRKTNHSDPGPGFPIDTLLAMVTSAPLPVSPTEGDDMAPYLHCECPSGGYWLVKPSDGGVFAQDGAPHFGALPGHAQLQAPIVDMAPYMRNGQLMGYWLLGADGGVFAFNAPFTGSYAGHPEWHAGERTFVGIAQHGEGYDLVSVAAGTDPPQANKYDLSVRR